MECESLFNDGFAVTILIFAKEILVNSVRENILMLVLKEIFGAVAVGIIVSFLMFKVLRMSNEPIVHILVSLLNVAIISVICDVFHFSVVMASVVAGLYFSMENQKITRWKEVVDPEELYNDFWNVASVILDGVLYVMVGLSVLSIELNVQTLILIPIAIILNIIARFASVGIGSAIVGKKHIPSKYSMKEFTTLLTVSGLKGGVSLALAMSLKDILTVESYNIVLTIVLITILFTTIVQGMISGKVYEKVEEDREKKYRENSLCVR